MTIVSQPEVTLSLASADLAVANTDQKILVVAQQADAGGSATALALSQQIGGDRAEDGLYGRTSHAALIVREIKRYAPQLHIDAIGVDNSGGVARVFTIALGTGPSTAAGTITLTVGSEKNHKFTYTTPAVGEAAAATATAIAALVEADLDCPYSAAAATTNVVLTADNKGTVANSDPIGTTGTAVGLAITQTETTPGSTDPTIATTIFDVIGSERYQQIVWGWDAAATVTTIKTFLDARFNTTNKILDGVAYIF
jgi:phage tail sheath gpL-like